ncbi:major paralogous domain-containing protein [Chryseobacterium rhizoplanae]|uniref:Major paralogous domain-containing protein n=1 Tax=Chryseobacterium rhizoplanae TaxID=1609531 RepID=A0A521DLD8_9FLAO|nr:FISUMP domain-containing protein [Chryseobacterium rhizoplanae]SMO72438.1 major paralogous domain-containing protein [Chryseobacterium rhizoplanae]
MKKIYLLPTVFLGILSYGQLGINNSDPKSTLDVVSKTTDGSTAEGFILPRVTGNALKAAEVAGVYGEDQNAVLVYVTEEPDPDNRTGQVEGMDSPGFYYFDAGSNRWLKMALAVTATAHITQLMCSSSSDSGFLEEGEPASGVNTSIPYNGGNGGTYDAISIPSTGVTGLTAILPSGTLNNGSGTLNFTIIGTPLTAGTAVFDLTIGGESCGFSRTVVASSSFADQVNVLINGQTRQMLTRNLGADPSQDPNVPSQSIMGNYYQWGKKNPVATAYTSSASISGWSTSTAANKSWNSGTEATPVKTANDPCPTGFRVPTRNEWLQFNSASTNTTIGTWVTAATNGSTNFSAAIVFSNNGTTLTLPTGGYRNETTGSLQNRARFGYYWSNTESSTNAFAINFGVSAINLTAYTRADGFIVRCISE